MIKRKNEFINSNYLAAPRWVSFHVQIAETLKTNPRKVLEIGKGFGITAFVLDKLGINLTTLDPDPNVNPTVVADVRKIPFRRESFDTILCFEVLEHLPFSDLKPALLEMRRVTKRFILLSLPEPYSSHFYFGVKVIPFLPKLEIFRKLSLSNWFFPKFDPGGTHKWEIGRMGISFKKVEKTIKSCQLRIIDSFYPKENLYHRFFILEKT